MQIIVLTNVKITKLKRENSIEVHERKDILKNRSYQNLEYKRRW